MYCKHCGKEIDNNAAFCMYCGCSLAEQKNKEGVSPMKIEIVEHQGKNYEAISRKIVKFFLKIILKLLIILAISFAGKYGFYYLFKEIFEPPVLTDEQIEEYIDKHPDYDTPSMYKPKPLPWPGYGSWIFDHLCIEYGHPRMNFSIYQIDYYRNETLEDIACKWANIFFWIGIVGLTLYLFIPPIYKWLNVKEK